MYLYERIAQEKERQKELEKMYSTTEIHKPDKRYVALMSSMSHTYGNALAFIQNWIMSIFPENMFKTLKLLIDNCEVLLMSLLRKLNL